MVTIITADEFHQLSKSRGRLLSPLGWAMVNLAPDTGLKTPCRWVHNHGCNGASTAHSVARRYGFKVHTTCKEGTFYILRSH